MPLPFSRSQIAIGALIAVGAFAAYSQKSSDDSEAQTALTRAQKADKAGDREHAISDYELAVRSATHDESPVTTSAGLALARLYLAEIPAPFTVDAVADAVEGADRYLQLGATAHSAGASALVVERLTGWSDSLGSGELRTALGQLELLDAAAGIEDDATTPLATRHREAIAALATQLAPDWPLIAFALHARSDAPTAAAAAASVLSTIADHESLLRAAGPDIDSWLAASPAVASDQRQAIAQQLAAARAAGDAPARATVLASEDPAPVAAWVDTHRHDQEAVLTLAAFELGGGDVTAARDRLLAMGQTGWLVPDAQRLRAAALAEAGQLDEAATVLDAVLTVRLPMYRRALRTLNAAGHAVEAEWFKRAARDDFPPALAARFEGKKGDAINAEFHAWVGEQIDADPGVAAARITFQRYADAVAIATELGALELRRASAATGDARAARLAAAERAFIAVRGSAADLPDYHLGLGQLYHRLGRIDEGETELKAVLDLDDPDQSMAVARAYRDLGREDRARDVARTVFDKGKAPHASYAATMLAVTADSDAERLEWLQKSDQSLPQVRDDLAQLKANELYRKGDTAGADAALAALPDADDKDVVDDSTGAELNNAALRRIERFRYTGDRRHLTSARNLFDRMVKSHPDSPIGLRNAAAYFQVLGQQQVLAAWVDVAVIRQPSSERDLLWLLARGKDRDKVLAALRRNPLLRRSRDLLRRSAALSPRDTSSHQMLASSYRLIDDTAALRALRDEVEARPATDDDDDKTDKPTAERDAESLAAIDGQVRALDAALTRVAAGDVATAGAIHALRSQMLLGRADIGDDLAAAEAAVVAARAALRWPALVGSDLLRSALITVALQKAAAVSPALATRWNEGRRTTPTWTIVYRALAAPADADALRATAEMTEAVADARKAPGTPPGHDEWLLAEVSGDPQLVARRSSPANEASFLRQEIALRLDPDDAEAKLVVELSAAKR